MTVWELFTAREREIKLLQMSCPFDCYLASRLVKSKYLTEINFVGPLGEYVTTNGQVRKIR